MLGGGGFGSASGRGGPRTLDARPQRGDALVVAASQAAPQLTRPLDPRAPSWAPFRGPFLTALDPKQTSAVLVSLPQSGRSDIRGGAASRKPNAGLVAVVQGTRLRRVEDARASIVKRLRYIQRMPLRNRARSMHAALRHRLLNRRVRLRKIADDKQGQGW